MTKVLTNVEIEEILQEYRARGEFLKYIDGSEYFSQTPPLLGQGYGRTIQLRPGLRLVLSDIKKRQIHIYKIRQHPQPMPLTLSYYLSGGCRVDNDGLKLAEEEVAGKSYLYCLPNTAEIEEYPAGQRICKVHIQISAALVQTFSDRLNELPTELRNAIQHPEKALLYYPSRITPSQQQVLKQILEWPYQGITRQFYLEGKVLELLALHFNQVLIGRSAQPATLKTRDIDRIYQAQSILLQNLAAPPPLSSLSRQVQLNERKLREGFRQVFDTTVFGYLTQQRMETACQLLVQQRSISAVAAAVGYASSTAFSGAFRKRFGMSPKAYQLAERR